MLDDERRGVEAGLAEVRKAIEGLARIDAGVGGWLVMLEQAWTNLDELRREASDYQDAISDDPRVLERMQHRRDEIARLVRKRGGTVEAVLEAAAEARRELELLDSAGFDERKLEAEVATAASELTAAAAALTAARTAAATEMAERVNRLLPALGLPGARFRVEMVRREAITASGAEGVELVATMNRGMPERPIASSASGGELARLMLAIKVVLAGRDAIPTLVFDEVDQGVGGEIAVQIAAALADLGSDHQVMVVTHSPQIAARGINHLFVAKDEVNGIATSSVAVLDRDARVVELARMLGDAGGVQARGLAEAMLDGERRTANG